MDVGRNSLEAKIHSYPHTPPRNCHLARWKLCCHSTQLLVVRVCHSLLALAKRQPTRCFKTHHQLLLTDLGTGDITEGMINDAEKFICHLYKVLDYLATHKARTLQESIWGQATIATPVLSQQIWDGNTSMGTWFQSWWRLLQFLRHVVR